MKNRAPQLCGGAANILCFQTQIGDRDAARRIIADAPFVLCRDLHHSRVGHRADIDARAGSEVA
ncbi:MULTISPECIES: hypothetical protein [unclassified Caballeronia]|uniref:hypothetical protein n=1 Tax=unclassified Caballeronia TaxID=2646786 RepID=UPI002029366D|nr:MULTISPECIES: hypothetical protein [unclassified Caballeronia]